MVDEGALISRNGTVLNIVFKGVRYQLRSNGSDLAVFHQIILYEELAPLVHYAEKLKRKDLVIMDCGANIGLSLLFFKKAFPDAAVICAEPEENNYKQLMKNIQLNQLTKVYPVQTGVWFEKSVLYENKKFRDGQDWSFSVQEKGIGVPHIPVDSISNIASSAGFGSIDILKIDIEGAEFRLFEKIETWAGVLENVKVISVEVHEEFGESWQIEEKLLAAGFNIRRTGELLIGIREAYV